MERVVSVLLVGCLVAGGVYGWLVTGRVLATVVGAVVIGLVGLVVVAVLSILGSLAGSRRRER